MIEKMKNLQIYAKIVSIVIISACSFCVCFGKNVSTASLLPKCPVSMSVEYDLNGNLIYVNTAREKKDGTKTDKNSERKLLWDEENRLEAIDDNGFVSNYWYDAAGERTVKTSGDAEQMYVNGLFSGGSTETAKFTAYVNAYMVVSKGGNYTKHIYIGSQRIVSKLGDLDSYGADPRRIEYAGSNVDGANVQYANKYTALQQTIKDRYAAFEVEYYGKDNDDYVNGQGFCCDDTPQNAPARVPSSNDNPELFQYYYHSDHLGSTSLITDLDGNVVQHIEYVPFGEVFIEERNNKWNTPYLFNAKELDEETGLYYYGARYYDPRVSLWLSADPMQEKYPNVSTYAYCLQNPIMLIDPDGNEVIPGLDTENSSNYAIIQASNEMRLQEDPNVIHIYAHGNSTGMTFVTGSGESKKETRIENTQQFIEFLNENSELWKKREENRIENFEIENITIVLHSCETGKELNGKSSFARKLSKEMPNVTIIAPNKLLKVGNDGCYEAVKDDNSYYQNGDVYSRNWGKWIVFKDGGIKDTYNGNINPLPGSNFFNSFSNKLKRLLGR
ncbi:hypothetical protein FACS189429_1800 [Bacteroidia bacterium]|nr:hypothetical protein FACS189429_1800 [Bacteroidia bacterium]GHV44119.1 hypothetical protein FACS1894180_5060 [Bacteroidia bacterium]